ncbi:hypothetical protein F5H01DRAFT_355737 [Linnemannia elongata]|nr:hypothetical protein F5H01DRAFT_355737 [Linnemannia elongata]
MSLIRLLLLLLLFFLLSLKNWSALASLFCFVQPCQMGGHVYIPMVISLIPSPHSFLPSERVSSFSGRKATDPPFPKTMKKSKSCRSSIKTIHM